MFQNGGIVTVASCFGVEPAWVWGPGDMGIGLGWGAVGGDES